MELVKTGISGLDSMLYGGMPDGSQVVLAGGPGSGKTLLSFEFLYRNAKMGIPGVFFALEEEHNRVLLNVKNVFTDMAGEIDGLIQNKHLIVDGEEPAVRVHEGVDPATYEFGRIVSDIETLVNSIGAKRVVIDSISLLDVIMSDPIAYRRAMFSLVSSLRRMGVTSLLTAETETSSRADLKFRPEYFLFDGILTLYQTGEEEKRVLAMEIIKMRGSKHSLVTTPYEITPAGFKVFAAEEGLL